MGIFSLDNVFGQFMDKIWKCIILNFLCLICSIPIITIGPATTALYAVVFKMAKGEEKEIVKSYFLAFRENFKKSFIIHVIMLFMAAILLLGLYYCKQLQNEFGLYRYWRYLIYAIGCIYIMVLLYVYPLLAMYENTVKGTLQNALLMPIMHIGWTVLMLAITIVPLYLCYVNADVMKWGLFFYLLCGVAFTAFIYAKILVRIFALYRERPEEYAEERK